MIELPGNRLLGLETKATAAPKAADARVLRWLSDEQPTGFVAGAVLHTGSDAIAFDDDPFALPVCAIWGSSAHSPMTSEPMCAVLRDPGPARVCPISIGVRGPITPVAGVVPGARSVQRYPR